MPDNVLTIKNDKRNDSIDIVKFIGIYLMVLCHCGIKGSFTVWVYSFHMPLFFIVSGFLTDINKQQRFVSYLERKFRQIMIPYLLFACILCFGSRFYADYALIFYGSRNAIASANSCTALWFLPCFFISSIFYKSVCLLAKGRRNIICALCVSCGVTGILLSTICEFPQRYPFNFDMALVGVLFMFIGHLMQVAVNKCVMKWGGVISLIVGSILAYLNTPESLTANNPHIEMSIGSIGNPVLFIITPTLIVFGLICISKLIEKVVPQVFKYVGKNTMVVLCMHEVLIYIFSLMARFLHVSHFIVMPFLYSILIIMAIKPIAFIFEKFFPNAVGKFQ